MRSRHDRSDRPPGLADFASGVPGAWCRDLFTVPKLQPTSTPKRAAKATSGGRRRTRPNAAMSLPVHPENYPPAQKSHRHEAPTKLVAIAVVGRLRWRPALRCIELRPAPDFSAPAYLAGGRSPQLACIEEGRCVTLSPPHTPGCTLSALFSAASRIQARTRP